MVKTSIDLSKKEFKDFEDLIGKMNQLINVRRAGMIFSSYTAEVEDDHYCKGNRIFDGYSEKEIDRRLIRQLKSILIEFINEE